MKTKTKILLGNGSRFTYWGKRGCSHGMYSRNNYDFYVYGIKGVFSIEIMKTW